MLATDGVHVGRHAGIGQEARQQRQLVAVGALGGGGRQVGGARETGEGVGVGGLVAVGYDSRVRP